MTNAPPPLWINRIAGHSDVDPTVLIAHPLNWRSHPENQTAALDAAIDDIGFWRSVTVNQTSGVIIDGHLRVARAVATGQPTIPVEWVTMNPDEEAKALATADSIAGRARTNTARLDELLRGIQAMSPGLQDFITSFAKEHKIFLDEHERVVDPGPQIDRAEALALKWETTPGQIWIIPSVQTPGRAHRILCGDSRRRDDVARLMDATVADIVVCDPPYGVAIVGRTADALTIENDDLGELGTRVLVGEAAKAWPLKPGGTFYVFSPAGSTEMAFRQALEDADYQLRQSLVWVKHHFVFSRMDYHWKHEMILYGWRDGAGHFFVPDRTLDTLLQDDEADLEHLSRKELIEMAGHYREALVASSTVWREDRPSRNLLHPTIKPMPLVARLLRNSSLAGDVCFDGFIGSGTTLLAAEETGRICHGIDVAAKYVAATLERAALAGLEPLLETR